MQCGLSAQPHAVRKAGSAVYCYDKNGNVTSRQGGALAWTSYNLPSSIVLGGSSTSFSYNADHQRWKQDANYAGTHEVTYYIGGILEKVTRGSGPTEYRHLIPAGSGSAILTRRSHATTSTYYTTSDHLGSGDLVLSSTGTVLAHESFSPFGARRGSNWQGTPTSADYTTFSTTTRRGFSGHEMLDSVGLVHMNGRVYDPLVGRFLSADPIIQTLAHSQALNPFSYVMNNPLALIDPSGYSWLSKLFHGVGHLFHSQVFRLVLAIAVAIALPYVAALSQWGIWSAMLQGAIVGGIAAGHLKGAAWGALAGSIAYGMANPGGVFNFQDGPSPSLLTEQTSLQLAGLAGAKAGKEAAVRSNSSRGEQLSPELGVSARSFVCYARTTNPDLHIPDYNDIDFSKDLALRQGEAGETGVFPWSGIEIDKGMNRGNLSGLDALNLYDTIIHETVHLRLQRWWVRAWYGFTGQRAALEAQAERIATERTNSHAALLEKGLAGYVGCGH